MSVIKIPSGSIYEKSTNILPDNVIKRIDVPYTRIVQKEEKNVSVYSTETKTFTTRDVSNSTSLITGRTLDYQNNYDFSGTYLNNGELLGYVYLKAKLTFCSGVFFVPKLHDNALITEIFAGITQDDSGKHNQISYALDGDYSSQTIVGKAVWVLDKVTSDGEVRYFAVNEPTVTGTSDETQSPYNLSGFPIDTNVQITVEKEYTDSGRTVKPSVTLNLDNDTRIGISVTETYDGYEITYEVLAGYEIDEMSGYNTNVDVSNLSVPISGFRRKFVPTEISFNINGVRLALDITEKVVTLADLGNSSSNKMMLYEGNEIISSAMKYGSFPIYYYFNTIYRNYNNGKETATIKCALGNYYDFDTGELCIRADGKNILLDDYLKRGTEFSNGITWTFRPDGKIIANGTATAESRRELITSPINMSGNTCRIYSGLILNTAKNYYVQVVYQDTSGASKVVNDYGEGTVLQNVKTIQNFLLVATSNATGSKTFSPMITFGSVNYDFEPPMPSIFKHLDQVIPMRYAVQRRILPDGTTEFYREDVPLSTYASGNPKKFQVLGVQFDYSGIGYQTLSLQEIAEN